MPTIKNPAAIEAYVNNYSTDNVEIRKFRPHGRVEISVYEAGIIHYIATGPFNNELAQALAEIDNKAVQTFKIRFGKWCELVTFRHSCMALDNSLASLAGHLVDKKDRGTAQLATAFVFTPDVEGRRIMASKYEQCYLSAGIKYKSFDNKDDALLWARAYL